VSQHISHITELGTGTSTLVLTLSLSAQAVTLEMREKIDREVRLHKLTDRCSALYKTGGSRRRLVGVLLHLTEGFGHLVDAYRILKVKHMVEGCIVLDVRNTDNDAFRTVIDHYASINKWLEPHRNLIIPRDFAQELRKLA